MKQIMQLLFMSPLLLLSPEMRGSDTLMKDSISPDKYISFSKSMVIKGTPGEVFAFMDDIENTGMHMTEKSGAMMGSKLSIEWLSENKTGKGAKYRWKGKVMGMKMDFTAEVTHWKKDEEKIWESVGEAKMIVINWYRMKLTLKPDGKGSTIADLSIDYTKKKGSFLALLFSRSYAKWCVKSMLKDTRKHFRARQEIVKNN